MTVRERFMLLAMLVLAVIIGLPLGAVGVATQPQLRSFLLDSSGNHIAPALAPQGDHDSGWQFLGNDTFRQWHGGAIEYDWSATFFGLRDNYVEYEGTADASEAQLRFDDPTADYGYYIPDSLADNYDVLGIPDGDVTGGYFLNPAVAGDDAVTTSSDNVLLCNRVYIPNRLTVGAAYARNVVASDTASDETLGVAIYLDADAGTRLATGISSDATTTENVEIDFTDVTLNPGMYRLCGCAQDVSGSSFHAATLDDESIDVMNSGAGPVFGTGANSCSSGSPPTTTGAITTADDNIPVIMLAGDSS